ncbi:hypothetical protein [Streptomyces kaempferi]|uniref:TetR family transcriptional regulator n=1 Tax=Streptomyces kaempferi TaxID=333725 RepID=A0ABW3XIW2_9ACTN
MSAAVPTDPGTVVLFRKKAPKHGRGRREETVPAPGETTPEQRLADKMERLYLKHDMTLTDPDTAQAFLIAMDAVQMMVQGGRVHKVIDEEQRAVFHAMLEGMKAAPRLV